MKPVFLHFLVAPSVLVGLASAADLAFDSPFTSHMVLQRGAPITLTGRGPADGEVAISLGDTTRSAEIGGDETWRVTFDAMPAGGPRDITVTDGSGELVLEDVLIGDVWLFAGQSNMQMGLDEAHGGPEAIESAEPATPVRLLTVPKDAAEEPQSDLGTEWRRTTPDSLRKFSAVAWFFAEHLRDDPALADVPLGLIDSSYGGTSIEGWTPAGELPDIPGDKVSGSMFGIPPGHLYNRMIAPLLAYRLKGAAWYQGEANAGNPDVYATLLENFIVRWRSRWDQPDLPFLVVQLPAYSGRMNGRDFGWLREAQACACANTDHAWIAVTYDTTDGFDLHPREKEEIGRRLSRIAHREAYGRDVTARGPRLTDVRRNDERLLLSFDQPVTTAGGEPPRGFAIAGAGGDYRYAEAEIRDDRVALRAEGVPAPDTVRYAWGGMPDANLVNAAGLPAVPFRTDDHPPRTLAFQPVPNVYRIETPAYALQTGRGGAVTSLIVGGQQFIAHEPRGGTRIPGGFGPRALIHTEELGPRRLALADNHAELEIACEDDSMTWTLTNGGGDPIELHIALAPSVTVSANGSTAELSKEGRTLRIENIARIENRAKVVAKAPARDSVELRWTIPTR